FLGEVAGSARLQRAHRIAVLGIHAEDQHRAARIALAQLLDELQAVLPRHVVVEHRDLPGHAPREVDHFLPVARLADHLEILLDREHLAQALAHDRMIVGDDYFHGVDPIAFTMWVPSFYRLEWRRTPGFPAPGCPLWLLRRGAASRAPPWPAGRASCGR